MRISDWSSDVCSSDLVLVSGMEGDDALPIRANARVAAASLRRGSCASYELGPGRSAYLVSAEGRVRVNGEAANPRDGVAIRSEEHTSELQSLMRISYAVFCLKNQSIRLHQQYHHNYTA